MATTLILLGLFILTAAFPLEGRWHNFRQRVLDVFRHDRVVETNNCKQLTTATLAWSRYAFVPIVRFPLAIRSRTATEIGKMAFGFDVFEDEAALEEFTCSITQAKTVTDLKRILDSQNNFNFRTFKLIYDYFVITLMIKKSDKHGSFEAMKSTGLLSLDPDGVGYMAELAEEMDPNHRVVELYFDASMRGNLEQKCDTLQDLFWRTLTSVDPITFNEIASWTGIDLHDKHQVNTLLCDIVKAAEVDIQSVYKILEENGIVDNFYRRLYPKLLEVEKRYKKHLELAILSLEESISDTDPFDTQRVYLQDELTMDSLILDYILQLEQSGLVNLV